MFLSQLHPLNKSNSKLIFQSITANYGIIHSNILSQYVFSIKQANTIIYMPFLYGRKSNIVQVMPAHIPERKLLIIFRQDKYLNVFKLLIILVNNLQITDKELQLLNHLDLPLRSLMMSGSFATSLAVSFSLFRMNTLAFLDNNNSTSS